MKYINRLFLLFFLAFWTMPVFAQEETPEMANTLRSNGKIYVVVLVLATIFAGLIIYLIRLDKKITQLEKNR